MIVLALGVEFGGAGVPAREFERASETAGYPNPSLLEAGAQPTVCWVGRGVAFRRLGFG
jgi:hypothetical protein